MVESAPELLRDLYVFLLVCSECKRDVTIATIFDLFMLKKREEYFKRDKKEIIWQ